MFQECNEIFKKNPNHFLRRSVGHAHGKREWFLLKEVYETHEEYHLLPYDSV
jgi:hypothetical protein